MTTYNIQQVWARGRGPGAVPLRRGTICINCSSAADWASVAMLGAAVQSTTVTHCSSHCSTQGRFCSNTLTHSRSRRQGRIHHSICKIFKNLYRVEARCVKEQLIEAGQKCTKKYCRHIDTPMTVPGPAESRGATCISTEYILTTPDQTIPTLQSEN